MSCALPRTRILVRQALVVVGCRNPPPPAAAAATATAQTQQHQRRDQGHARAYSSVSCARFFSSQASSSSSSDATTTSTTEDNEDNEPIVRGAVVVSREDVQQEETKRKRLSEVRRITVCVHLYLYIIVLWTLIGVVGPYARASTVTDESFGPFLLTYLHKTISPSSTKIGPHFRSPQSQTQLPLGRSRHSTRCYIERCHSMCH